MEILTKENFEEFAFEIKGHLLELRELINERKGKRIIKNKELKEYLGCSYSTLEKMRQTNLIPYKKVLGNYYYDIDEIDKIFLN